MDDPLVSVLMPVYNGLPYVVDAIASIRAQSYDEFEIVIVDDGSSDGSSEAILGIGDPRIRYIRNDSNRGIVYCLNMGVSECRGKYIVRMDADDICFPERLHVQVQYMESHLNIGVCGAALHTFGARNEVWNPPSVSEMIKVIMLFKSALYHPTVIARKEIFLKYRYREGFDAAEDFDLWERLLESGVEMTNIPKVLLKYRLHAEMTSIAWKDKQEVSADKIRLRQLKKMNLFPDAKCMGIHRQLSRNSNFNELELRTAAEWMRTIIHANNKFVRYDADLLKLYLSRRWISLCGNSMVKGRQMMSIFLLGPRMPLTNLKREQELLEQSVG